MKKFKKLIPAFCMLLISAVMLGSSTYAWFAMNNQVTATGMEVKAASNTQYLVISKDNTLGTDRTLDQANMIKKGGKAGGNTENAVFPCAKAKQALTGVNVGEWYTANSTDFDNEAAEGSDKMTNIKKLTGTTGANDNSMDNYWMTYTFYIGLATGSKEYTGDLKITNSATLASAVKAIIRIGEDNEIELTSEKAEDTLTSITLNTAATTVTVILYVDGNDSNVKSSSDITKITGSLSLAFEITPTV